MVHSKSNFGEELRNSKANQFVQGAKSKTQRMLWSSYGLSQAKQRTFQSSDYNNMQIMADGMNVSESGYTRISTALSKSKRQNSALTM